MQKRLQKKMDTGRLQQLTEDQLREVMEEVFRNFCPASARGAGRLLRSKKVSADDRPKVRHRHEGLGGTGVPDRTAPARKKKRAGG